MFSSLFRRELVSETKWWWNSSQLKSIPQHILWATDFVPFSIISTAPTISGDLLILMTDIIAKVDNVFFMTISLFFLGVHCVKKNRVSWLALFLQWFCYLLKHVRNWKLWELAEMRSNLIINRFSKAGSNVHHSVPTGETTQRQCPSLWFLRCQQILNYVSKWLQWYT